MKYKKCLWLVFALFLILVFTRCAGKKSTKKDPFFEKWKVMAENSKGHSPSAGTRAIELQEEKKGRPFDWEPRPAPEKLLSTQKITLKMQAVEVPVLLRALARLTDQNIMINTGVEGKININVKNAPWDQVFRGILRTHGLAYAWEGGIIRIMTLEDMEHDLKIDAIQEKRKAQELGIKRVEPLATRVININFADANKLKENLKEFLTKDKEGKPRGSVMVDEHTNSLIIQAIMDDITKMIPLIKKLDRPTPQILIEAHIVETTRETARELGIQWGGLYHDGDYWITPGANTGGVLGKSQAQGVDPTSGMAANFPATLGDTGLTIGYVVEDIGKGILGVQLSVLQNEGKLNILSSPSITTLDNKKATIESGAEVPFQTIDSEGNIEIQWKKATLKLEATPHVIEDRIVKMKIITKKDELDFTNTVQGNPTIITKVAETNVILYDGQTTVIGGLTKESISESEAGVPGLKDIPLLGYLFKREGKRDKMEEVLIFITPHILKKRTVGDAQEPGEGNS